MKRLARILGVLGGLGALAWAMRDRFVSVAISREPEPPVFRGTEPPPALPEVRSATDLTRVNGIGPVYATRLEAAGISTIEQLASSQAESIASAAEVPVSRANSWIESARSLS